MPVRTMYVYFDDEMAIKSITPNLTEELDYKCTEIPVDVLMPYLRGEKALNSCFLKPHPEKPLEYTVETKELEVNTIKILDKFLHQIPESTSNDFHLKIFDNPESKTMTFKVIEEYYHKILGNRTVESNNLTVNGVPNLDFYVTTKNDPSFLYFGIRVPTNQLLSNGEYIYKYDGDTENCSIFTKKIFTKYIYERQEWQNTQS